MEGVLVVGQVLEVHRFDLVAEAGAVGLLERVVLKGYDELLASEEQFLELKGGVPELPGVGLLVSGAVVKGESQVLLGGRHLHQGGIGERDAGVALVAGMVIDHHPVHHSAFVVPVVYPEYIALYAVIEDAGRDLDLVLGLVDVIAQRIYLVVCDRHEVVGRIEGEDADDGGRDEERGHDAHQRHAGALDGDELVVLTHLADGPH